MRGFSPCSLRQQCWFVLPRAGRGAGAGLGLRVVDRTLLFEAPAFLSRRTSVSTVFGRKCKSCPRAAFSDSSPASVLGWSLLGLAQGRALGQGLPPRLCPGPAAPPSSAQRRLLQEPAGRPGVSTSAQQHFSIKLLPSSFFS